MSQGYWINCQRGLKQAAPPKMRSAWLFTDTLEPGQKAQIQQGYNVSVICQNRKNRKMSFASLREHDRRFVILSGRGKGSERIIFHPNVNGRPESYPMTFHKGRDVGKGMLKAIIRRFRTSSTNLRMNSYRGLLSSN